CSAGDSGSPERTKLGSKGEAKPDCCSSHSGQSHSGQSHSGQSHSGQSNGAAPDSVLLASTSATGNNGNKTCSCSHARAHAGLFSETNERDDLLKKDLLKKQVGALLPTAARGNQSCHAIEVRVRCKPIPRARTGPPLQLIYQVFLI
ncbi:MAG: hypothetical protein ACI9SE_003902, partial [Neolewinella sp.]